jgi:hypothetical protein
MNDKFDQLAKRFEDIETRTDKRIGNEEIEVEVDELPLVF